MIGRVLLSAIALLLTASNSFAQRGSLDPSSPMPETSQAERMQPRFGAFTRELGSVNGSVSTLGGQPIKDAQVKLQDIMGGGVSANTYTDGSGRFAFSAVPSGTYEIVAVSGIYQAVDRIQVNSMPVTAVLRLPVKDAPPRDGAGASTISVAQYRVPQKARDEFLKAQDAMSKLKIEEAQKHVERALEIHPSYADALTLRAILELNGSDTASAVNDTQKAIQSDGNYALAYTVLASALNATGRFDEALQTLQRSETLAPDAWQTYYEQAKAYLGKSDYQATMQRLDRARALNTGDFPQMHLVRAYALIGMNQYPEAGTELENFLTRTPDGPEAEQARLMLAKVKGTGK